MQIEQDILKLISNFTLDDKIEFKKHSYLRMVERSISSSDVKNALKNCTIIKSYKKDKPLPGYLVLGYTDSKKPIHIVLSIDEKQGLFG